MKKEIHSSGRNPENKQIDTEKAGSLRIVILREKQSVLCLQLKIFLQGLQSGCSRNSSAN